MSQYYETIGVDNQGVTAFVTVRRRDNRIVFGPLRDEDRVNHETVKRNANDATRVCLALAAGRELFAQAMLDPLAGAHLVPWRPMHGGGELAPLDGAWSASIKQPAPDALYELTIMYGGIPVGRPVLSMTPEMLRAKVLQVYASRAG